MRGSQGGRNRYEEKIKDEINLTLRRDISHPVLTFVSVTKVTLNKDYSAAMVYWDTFDDKKRGEITEALKGAAGKIRSLLATLLKLRHTPSLTFKYDSQYHDEAAIDQLIKSDPNYKPEE